MLHHAHHIHIQTHANAHQHRLNVAQVIGFIQQTSATYLDTGCKTIIKEVWKRLKSEYKKSMEKRH